MGKVEITALNTSKLKTLSQEKSQELMRQAKMGNKQARNELVMGNLKLVLSVVQRFSSRAIDPDDLFQVGVIGLIKAINNFDDTLGLKLSTYAVPLLEGEIKRYVRDLSGSIHVSRSLRDIAYHALKTKEELMIKNNKEPSLEEIAKEMKIEPKKVLMALEAVTEPISLYEPVFNDDGDSLYVADQIGDNSNENDWIDEISLKEALQALLPREKLILSKRFLQGKTQTEVANEIGISQAQVSRLEKAALNRLKSE